MWPGVSDQSSGDSRTWGNTLRICKQLAVEISINADKVHLYKLQPYKNPRTDLENIYMFLPFTIYGLVVRIHRCTGTIMKGMDI